MTTWVLLAPGPSASAEQAKLVQHLPTGAVGNSFQLAPWASFVAHSDAGWWRKHPEAKTFPELYAMGHVGEAKRITVDGVGSICNSGVLGLEVCKKKGAKRIILLGFDMHGSHFFGKYTNGLRNTAPHQRKTHLKQYESWAKFNRHIEVINCTPGTALTCFATARLEECLRKSNISLIPKETMPPTCEENLMGLESLMN